MFFEKDGSSDAPDLISIRVRLRNILGYFQVELGNSLNAKILCVAGKVNNGARHRIPKKVPGTFFGL